MEGHNLQESRGDGNNSSSFGSANLTPFEKHRSWPRDQTVFFTQLIQYDKHAFPTVASSLFSDTATWVSSQLQAAFKGLPPSAQSYIANALTSLRKFGILPHHKTPDTLSEQILNLYSSSSSLAILFAALGPLLILLFSMSSWWPSSGRYSPFAAYTTRGPPQVTQDDFTYLDSDRRPQGHHDHHDQSYRQNSTQAATGPGRNDDYGLPKHTVHPDLDLDPDILVLKHKGTTYPLHFPAFSIAESLKVGELRWQAAKKTKCEDPRRVKLLYKGRSLRDDSKMCREEGLKQNSELMCVVSSDASAAAVRDEDGNESSSSASSAAIANGVDAVQREPKVTRRKGHRGGGGKTRATRETRFDDGPRGRPGDSYLAPPNGGPLGTDRSPSRDRTATTAQSPSPQPAATATATPAAPPVKKPTTPAEILQAVSDDFNANFLPKVRHLLDHPPKIEKERIYESKKLSEGILTQVLFKLDGVQTEDEGIKARRKECVKLANFWIQELDKLQKK